MGDTRLRDRVDAVAEPETVASPTSDQRFGATRRRFLVALLAVAAVFVIAVAFATTIVTSLVIVTGSICVVVAVNRLTDEARGGARLPGAGDASRVDLFRSIPHARSNGNCQRPETKQLDALRIPSVHNALCVVLPRTPGLHLR